jgi:hypothetical protein
VDHREGEREGGDRDGVRRDGTPGRSVHTITFSINIFPSQCVSRRSRSFWLATFPPPNITVASAAGDHRGGIEDTIRLSK